MALINDVSIEASQQVEIVETMVNSDRALLGFVGFNQRVGDVRRNQAVHVRKNVANECVRTKVKSKPAALGLSEFVLNERSDMRQFAEL